MELVRETSARLLRLLSLLQTHREWSGAELADRLGVTERTVRRDVDRIRTLGYSVDAQPGSGAGYRLRPGSVLPPLLLDDDEAVSIAVGLHSATMSGVSGVEEPALQALTKLEQVLPARLKHRWQALQQAIVPLSGGGPVVDVAVLVAVAGAVRDHQRLRAGYTDHAGTSTRRLLEPHRMVHAGRRWYLVAWDVDKAAWRTLRLDRLQPTIPTGPRFVPREAPEADLAAYTTRGISTAVYRHQCRVTVMVPASVLTEQVGPTIGVVRPLDGESCQLVTGGTSLEEVALHLGLLGHPFLVREPPELRRIVAELGARLSAAADPQVGTSGLRAAGAE